jgi:sec-independent protein translocase protein TatC
MALLSFLSRRGGDEKSEMSFVDHLEALRWHLVRAVIAVLTMAGIIFLFQDEVFDYIILGPLDNKFITYRMLCEFSQWAHMGDTLCMPAPKVNLLGNEFGTQFFSSISIAFIGGFIAAFPYVFWEVWRFIKPALSEKEKNAARGAIFWVSFFFFLGAAFGYFILGPFTFSFLSNYKLGTKAIITTFPTLDNYIDMLTNVTLGAGLAFQLPIVSYVLSKIGIITPKFLRTYRKYAVVAILIVAAVITPSPDWMSQMIVFVPLWGLYELGIVIAARNYKQRMKEEKQWS